MSDPRARDPHARDRRAAGAQPRSAATIVRAATRIARDCGIAGLTLDEVAEAAGKSSASVRDAFGTERELLLAMFEQLVTDRVRRIAAARTAQDSASRSERLRAIADDWLESDVDDPGLLALELELRARAAREPALGGELGIRAEVVRLALGRALADLGVQGRPGLSGEDLATVIEALALGLAAIKMNEPDAFRVELLGDFLEAVFASLDDGAAP